MSEGVKGERRVRPLPALIATLHLKHGYTQAQIAEHLGLHYVTVSRIVNRQTDARNKT